MKYHFNKQRFNAEVKFQNQSFLRTKQILMVVGLLKTKQKTIVNRSSKHYNFYSNKSSTIGCLILSIYIIYTYSLAQYHYKDSRADL